MIKATLCSCIVSIMLLLPGCGGGSGNAVQLPTNTAIVLSAIPASGFTNTAIKAIQVTFVLPQTATPTLNADGSPLIGETGLKILNLNGQIFQDSVSYNSATGTMNFTILANPFATGDLGTGDIARLTYVKSSGAQLSAQEIQNIKQTLLYKVSGPGSVDISSEIVPSVSIVTYQKP